MAKPLPPVFYIFWSFLVIGSLTFGGGYGMIPIMQHDFVIVKKWLTDQQFNDAVAIGMITPGPVAILATFIGYRLHYLLGAIAATIGVFAPSVGVVYFASRFYIRFEKSKWAQVILPIVNASVIGLLFSAIISLGKISVSSPLMFILATVTFALTYWTKLSPIWVILGCGLGGIFFM